MGPRTKIVLKITRRVKNQFWIFIGTSFYGFVLGFSGFLQILFFSIRKNSHKVNNGVPKNIMVFTYFHWFWADFSSNTADFRCTLDGCNFFHRHRRTTKVYIFEKYSTRSVDFWRLIHETNILGEHFRRISTIGWTQNPVFATNRTSPNWSEQGFDLLGLSHWVSVICTRRASARQRASVCA